jgi:hypothetical protein
MHVVRDEHAQRLTSGEAKAAVSAEASHLLARMLGLEPMGGGR